MVAPFYHRECRIENRSIQHNPEIHGINTDAAIGQEFMRDEGSWNTMSAAWRCRLMNTRTGQR
jgi:hypothetical protein